MQLLSLGCTVTVPRMQNYCSLDVELLFQGRVSFFPEMLRLEYIPFFKIFITNVHMYEEKRRFPEEKPFWVHPLFKKFSTGNDHPIHPKVQEQSPVDRALSPWQLLQWHNWKRCRRGSWTHHNGRNLIILPIIQFSSEISIVVITKNLDLRRNKYIFWQNSCDDFHKH